MTFWEFIWLIFISYIFVAYLMMIFSIFRDIFRNPDMGGFTKFLWIFFIIVAVFLGPLVYLIVNGRNMTARQIAGAQANRAEQEAHIRSVARGGSSATDQIVSAKALLDSGAITHDEYATLKTKALA